jgi:hypothetical protein
MSTTTSSTVTEVSEFVHRYLPEKLEVLIHEFPQVDELKKPGGFMGDPKASDKENLLEYNIARLSLSREIIPNLRKASSFVVAEVLARVRLGKKVRTFSEILTLVSSTALLGALVTDEQTAAKILAGITFLSSVANIAVEYVLDLNNPHLANAREIIDEIIRNDARLARLEGDIELALRFRVNEQIETLIVQVNSIFEFVNRILLSLHGTPYEPLMKAEVLKTPS